jgi:hypothetical protein
VALQLFSIENAFLGFLLRNRQNIGVLEPYSSAVGSGKMAE